jgi:hypothetical protein
MPADNKIRCALCRAPQSAKRQLLHYCPGIELCGECSGEAQIAEDDALSRVLQQRQLVRIGNALEQIVQHLSEANESRG